MTHAADRGAIGHLTEGAAARLPRSVASMWRGLLDLLFPPACAACGVRPAPGPFCGGCAARLEVPPRWRCVRCAGPLPLPADTRLRLPRNVDLEPHACAECTEGAPFDGICAAFVHGGAAQEAIHRLKYGGRREVARTLGPLLATATLPFLDRFDVVAPIPLHVGRRRERGYDQAALLAAALARALGRPLRPDLLLRVRATDRQVGLDRAERLENLAGAFAATEAASGLRIGLVDDVITTGATARAAAEALRQAGAASVLALSFSRAGH